jgi:hypothetical protein
MRIHPDALIEAARRKTGLSEFDELSFREPLEMLVAGIEARGAQAEAIAGALESEIVGQLANRLRVADHLRRNPELLEAPLDVPLVVMGMPRTGTTLLSYLFDRDPRWRSLLNWEAVDSVPPPTTGTLRTDPRCIEKKNFQQQILPHLPFSIPHWEWADGPTECIFVQSQDFKALMWESRVPCRDYAEYMLSCDMTSAYEYQKKVLRVLQSRAPGRWVLKMPSHALHFRWALEAFPEARFVWTHRNPFRALASLGTTISVGHLASFGDVDKEHIHGVYPHQIAEHANRPMRLRERLPADKVFDVYCGEFLRDPIAGMRDLYAWLGESMTQEVEAAMRAWLRTDAERQATRPSYGLEDFGWTAAGVAPLFAEYLERYPRAREA